MAEEDENTEENLLGKSEFLNNLPFIDHCNVCYDDEAKGAKGFILACKHSMCIGCTRNLFFAAVRDSSLLPLRCCEVPIDVNICHYILPAEDVGTLKQRIVEREATNKMFCPSCNKFINLDYVDAQDSSELICICDTALCISCKTVAHPRYSCIENRAVIDCDDTLLLEVARENGWKQL